jgi:hypothetical protein
VNAAPAPSGIDDTSAFISSWSAAVATAATKEIKAISSTQQQNNSRENKFKP